ncbi:hypothetical protein BpHYR1_024331 [Brachionus plicatilis]|uniref:Uncharacterized protein n=1 Tax=Brachionus plicatilis TaxID=10195 RepID=A0A3M7Q9Z2_BRAPC|nr:hypothetical protein BpHYR1_024331 [Brachionus plicatilis]
MSVLHQILVLIDNNCSDLNIGSISEIINLKFSQSHVSLNGEVIEKSLIANYLPITTSENYLDMSKYSWSTIKQFSEVILISQDSSMHKKIRIFALFYRIITGKSIILFYDSDLTQSFILFKFFPIFLNIYHVSKMTLYDFPEVHKITNLNEHFSQICSSFESTPKNSRDFYKDYKIFTQIYLYILNGGRKWKNITDGMDDYYCIDKLVGACEKLEREFINEAEFKFYDAQYALYPSLGGKLQVSIPGPNQKSICVFRSLAADYNFRNLKYKNVLVSTKQGHNYFVLPFYKDEQSTRQTVRFLIMNLYKVFNNSLLVDFIVIYLYMKVCLLDDSVVRTKYENMARLFMKRHGNKREQQQFIRDNKQHLFEIKKFFGELENFDDNDLVYLFSEFVESDLNFLNKESVEKFKVVYVEETDVLQLEENELENFECAKLSQNSQIVVNEANWPKNLNFKCRDQLLQLNSSSPFFICTSGYDDFLAQIDQISWFKTILKYTNKLVLKGGAILDLLCKRKPKDFDLMNTGMTNKEFMDFLVKFCRDERPEKIEFVQSSVVLFRLSLTNGDKLELILNLNMDMDKLVTEAYLPDQICFDLAGRKLVANEFTLWALNYGYCELDLERHPRSSRVSSKLNKLGFNFYFHFCNENKFLKERLERYVWSIYQSEDGARPSYSDSKKTRGNICKILKGRVYSDGKLIFVNTESFMKAVKNLTENKYEKEVLYVDFSGGYILPNEKADSLQLCNGIDWSF